jgi:secreted PhoX family phosphatase
MDRILSARVSRRIFLNVSALAASGIVGFGSTAKAATAKVPKETVNYQPTPRGAAHCAACAYFQAPSACTFVDGPISPSGWCILFKAK